MCRPYKWVFGPKFSNQGSFFGRFSINMGGLVIQKLAKNSQKMGRFPPKFIMKVSITASLSN